MIIPVMDIMNNDCVSGKSGNRSSYTHLNSVYGDTPLDIAKNLKKAGAKAVYIADLDKIENTGDNLELISSINNIIPVLLDSGISNINDIKNDKNKCTYPILATETMDTIEETYEIFKNYDSNQLVFSIDIKNNQVLLKNNNIELKDIIELINKVKPKYTIILNISQVGTKKQSDTQLTEKIIKLTPHTTHFIAGGLTNKTIHEYKMKNINNFLVGTILHEGNLESKL